MMLYLLRHGEAEPQAATDSVRKLTLHGVEEVASVARQFIESRMPLDRCLTSPYDRAKRTAEIFLDQVNPELDAELSDILTPETRASTVMAWLETLQDKHILLVSHNPLMSELNALLTEGNINQMHILGTSELVAINIDVIGLDMGSTVVRLLPDKQPVTN